MDYTQMTFPNAMEFQQGYNWSTYIDDPFESILDAPPLLLDCPPPPLEPPCNENSLSLLPHYEPNYFIQNTYMFSGFGDISEELSYWESKMTSPHGNNELDIKPQDHAIKALTYYEDMNIHAKKAEPLSYYSMSRVSDKKPLTYGEEGDVDAYRRTRTSTNLDLEEIQKHFNMPITKAAKRMNVGLTILKKRCRELNIMRWPHRKLKSLQALINNVKEFGMTDEVRMLEEHKRLMERVPDLELTERTKKLRQACFKANYKKRRSLAIAHGHY